MDFFKRAEKNNDKWSHIHADTVCFHGGWGSGKTTCIRSFSEERQIVEAPIDIFKSSTRLKECIDHFVEIGAKIFIDIPTTTYTLKNLKQIHESGILRCLTLDPDTPKDIRSYCTKNMYCHILSGSNKWGEDSSRDVFFPLYKEVDKLILKSSTNRYTLPFGDNVSEFGAISDIIHSSYLDSNIDIDNICEISDSFSHGGLYNNEYAVYIANDCILRPCKLINFRVNKVHKGEAWSKDNQRHVKKSKIDALHNLSEKSLLLDCPKTILPSHLHSLYFSESSRKCKK